MITIRRSRLCAAVLTALLPVALPVLAQDASSAAGSTKAKNLDRVTVTGSRIKQSNKVTSAPVSIISRETIDKSGATSVGQFLQQLTASGAGINTKINSSGNQAFPPGGGGIAAGSSEVDLRNLGPSRVLVLVDGIRWINESSASGVSGSVDLNTIPLAIVERIEVLEDGASAIYGSDAIAGVVNIITKKKFDGADVHVKYGSYGHGGDETEGDATIGGSSDRFSGVFSASYSKSDRISSAEFSRNQFAVPGATSHGSSSGTLQGRFDFCDPRIAAGTYGSCDGTTAGNSPDEYDITLNTGALPNYNGGNPVSGAGTYHNFTAADRFNYAPFNLLLTPNERKSLFATAMYNINDSVALHGKLMYSNRDSVNQAAPEPIFVGQGAGTGGIADTISISHLNPYNPTGIDLISGQNFDLMTKRPVELGPRIFTQDVNTWYLNLGLTGSTNWGMNGMDWNADYVHAENRASQDFVNGFNVAKMKIALGDPAICAATPGCVPLDLFGGQARPITTAMFNYISTPQHDESTQKLDVFNANLTGDLWAMGDSRNAGFAVGYEHRRYEGSFNPDPLRQTGESQDSFATPVNSSYSVNEGYGELQVPWAQTFSTDFAVRYSNYSTFGGATTGKAGFRWQPVEDFVLRGTYSQGFRAPSLGELFGLTQFGSGVQDPCNALPSGAFQAQYAAACNAAHVVTSAGHPFEQSNPQITTFTGGNPNLQPEKSDNYNIGGVYSPSWADNLSWSSKLDFELDYFHYKIKRAIGAPDVQSVLNACYAGTLSGADCAGFTRNASNGQLNPPTDFLANLNQITTTGIDIKSNWLGPQTSWGQFSAALQASHALSYKKIGPTGIVDPRVIGRELQVDGQDTAIFSWKDNLQLGWKYGDWNAAWNLRYLSSVSEDCSTAGRPTSFCPDASGNPAKAGFHKLGATTYNDVQLSWNNSFGMNGLKLSVGANNIFSQNPPVCVTCSLNGYDASDYDLPFRFWYVDLNFKF